MVFLVSLLFSSLANAAQVSPLFDPHAHVVGSLIAFKVTGSDVRDIRRYEVEGAAPDECRLGRDPYYPDVFQLKCMVEKSGIRLRFTLFTAGQVVTVYSDPLDVKPVQDTFIEIKPISVFGGP